jgi:hypothetical protein
MKKNFHLFLISTDLGVTSKRVLASSQHLNGGEKMATKKKATKKKTTKKKTAKKKKK